MPTVVSAQAKAKARSLRCSMTDGERRLWGELRRFRKLYGIHVRRQTPIGPYVVDFAIHAKRQIIELDGEFHFSKHGIQKDQLRDRWFKERGYTVLRINTAEFCNDPGSCIEWLLRELGVAK